MLAACTPGLPPDLVEVTPPAELAQLDVTVREQFDTSWQALHEIRGNNKALGLAWGRMGQWFDAYNYKDDADRCYTNAQLLDPEDARWPYYQGMIEVNRGNLGRAKQRFTEAAQLAPDIPAPLVQLGDVELAQSRLDAAESSFRRALTLEADNPGGLFGIGRVALERGKPEAAREVLERLLILQPEASQVHYSLALAWQQLGDRKRAAEHMHKVPESNNDQIALATRDPWLAELSSLNRGAVALTRRAVRAANQGNRQQAAFLFGQAAIADPVDPDKRTNYAKSLIAMGETAGAIHQLKKALELSRDRPEPASRAHLELGSLYSRSGQTKLAETQLRAALENDPESVAAHVWLGRLQQSLGRYEEALSEYAGVRSMHGANTEVSFWHAALLVILKRDEDARKAIEEDLVRLGSDKPLRNLLARVLATSADPAAQDLARARELLGDEEKPDVLFAETISMVAAAQGRFSEAQAWQRAAIGVLDDDQTRLAAHIARRRLVLYEQNLPCLNPWEKTERVVLRKVQTPATNSRGSP